MGVCVDFNLVPIYGKILWNRIEPTRNGLDGNLFIEMLYLLKRVFDKVNGPEQPIVRQLLWPMGMEQQQNGNPSDIKLDFSDFDRQ